MLCDLKVMWPTERKASLSKAAYENWGSLVGSGHQNSDCSVSLEFTDPDIYLNIKYSI